MAGEIQGTRQLFPNTGTCEIPYDRLVLLTTDAFGVQLCNTGEEAIGVSVKTNEMKIGDTYAIGANVTVEMLDGEGRKNIEAGAGTTAGKTGQSDSVGRIINFSSGKSVGLILQTTTVGKKCLTQLLAADRSA